MLTFAEGQRNPVQTDTTRGGISSSVGADHSSDSVLSDKHKHLPDGLLSRSTGATLIVANLVLFVFLSVSTDFESNAFAKILPASLADVFPLLRIFFLAGCCVFGGGPVVVPLLLLQLTAANLITAHDFLTAFAVVQLLPGPMFNIACFFGALRHGVCGALLCWSALMLPGVLIALGCLPWWTEAVAKNKRVRAALAGLNAAAAGLMAGAVLVLWQTLISGSGGGGTAGGAPIGTAGGSGAAEDQKMQASGKAALVVVAFAMQEVFGMKPYQVVLTAVVAGVVMGVLGV